MLSIKEERRIISQGADAEVYYQPTCPSITCGGPLVVEFDNYKDPTMANIICKRCGYVVVSLTENGMG